MITILLVAAALAFVFWPRGGSPAPAVPAAAELFKVAPLAAPPAPPPTANTRAAIDSLLDVQWTLTEGGPVDPESAKALDRLWLDLFHARGPKS